MSHLQLPREDHFLFSFSSFYLFIFINTHIFSLFSYFCMRTDTIILISLLAIAARIAVKPADLKIALAGLFFISQDHSILNTCLSQKQCISSLFCIRIWQFCLKSSCGAPFSADTELHYWQGKHFLLVTILKCHWCQAHHASWKHSSLLTKERQAGSPFSSASHQDNITHLKTSNECERKNTSITTELIALLSH